MLNRVRAVGLLAQVDTVKKHMGDPETASRALAKEAYRRGSTDNISVIVVFFTREPTGAGASAGGGGSQGNGTHFSHGVTRGQQGGGGAGSAGSAGGGRGAGAGYQSGLSSDSQLGSGRTSAR